MSCLHLDAREVESLFPMAEAVEVVEGALAALARGEAIQPLRQPLWTPDRSGLLGLMPGMLLGTIPEEKGLPPVMGLKAVSVFLGRHPSHQGLVLLFDALRGTPLAILDGESITAIRTAAASGVATRHLAREDAAELAILGAGVQAAAHLEAMRAVRPVERVRVWSRTPGHCRRFAEEQSAAHGIPVEPVPSPRDAVHGADLVCTCTSSAEPVLEGEWLRPGTHVNAVGACTPKARELDAVAVARARVYVDSRESAAHEAGDLLLARAEGAIEGDPVVGELGEVILGRVPGRATADEITLFESLGLAVEDLASAVHVLAKARAAGRGTVLES